MPHLIRLRDRTGWSAHLGELHGREVVYLTRVATRRSIASTVHVGTRLPARRTTMGRVLLSGLLEAEIRNLYDDAALAADTPPTNLADLLKQAAEDRREGSVVQNSVYEPGVASVAAPIHDMTDRVVAAINISAVSLFTNDAELNGALKAEVIATAQAISQDLGSQGPRPPRGRPRSRATPQIVGLAALIDLLKLSRTTPAKETEHGRYDPATETFLGPPGRHKLR